MDPSFGIPDAIAVYSFRIMKQSWTDEERVNIDVHRLAVRMGLRKNRAIYIYIYIYIYILIHSVVR